jgi:FkbM family methyltransferase
MIDFREVDNVSILDLLVSKMLIFTKMDLIKVIVDTTNNWASLPLSYFSGGGGFTAKFRDGKTKTYGSMIEFFNDAVIAYLIKSGKVKERGGAVEFDYGGRRVAMLGGLPLCAGLIFENFLNDQYSWLTVEDKTVIDIGANIGDTAIYFGIRGAKRVYAFEPYPYAYRFARENIKLNGLGDRVEVLNEACGGSKDACIKIDRNFKSLRNTALKDFHHGKAIRIESIGEIVERFGLDGAVLKIDCEGYEYGIILDSSRKTLRRFDQIMVEYHFGYINIVKKLKEAGFSVKHTMPMFVPDRSNNAYGMLEGNIRAVKV